MNTTPDKDILEQLLNAIDAKDYTAARYKLCRAIEAANDNTKPKTTTTPSHEGQA